MLDQLASGLEAADPAAVVASMTDDVTLRVAVHDEPFCGLPATTHILAAVLDGALYELRVTETISKPSTDTAVLMFTARVAQHPGSADGLLVVRSDPQREHRICDLTVFLRPLDALAALAEEMGRRLGGPRPGGGAR